MAGPRFGDPGGFGGAFDDPSKGEFQPGDEVGVIDPNAGRFWSKGYNATFTLNSTSTGASFTRSATTSAPSFNPRF